MKTVNCYAIEINGRYYNRTLKEFTDLYHATLYELENPEDIKLLQMDKKQLLERGFQIHHSTVKLAC